MILRYIMLGYRNILVKSVGERRNTPAGSEVAERRVTHEPPARWLTVRSDWLFFPSFPLVDRLLVYSGRDTEI